MHLYILKEFTPFQFCFQLHFGTTFEFFPYDNTIEQFLFSNELSNVMNNFIYAKLT